MNGWKNGRTDTYVHTHTHARVCRLLNSLQESLHGRSAVSVWTEVTASQTGIACITSMSLWRQYCCVQKYTSTLIIHKPLKLVITCRRSPAAMKGTTSERIKTIVASSCSYLCHRLFISSALPTLRNIYPLCRFLPMKFVLPAYQANKLRN